MRLLFGAEAGATSGGIPKDDDIASSNGASPNGSIDPEERASLDRVHEGYRELHEQLVAEGFDGSEELAALRLRAAAWSQ
jgi:hypothetical protein